MKIEYLPDASADCPLVRFYNFVPSEVAELRAICRKLYDGSLDEYSIDSIPGLETVGGCRITLKAGSRDRGLVPTSPPAMFEWILTRGTWDNVDGLLEPFEIPGVKGFQWLDSSTETSVLISRDGIW
jgi:hypothetical protein